MGILKGSNENKALLPNEFLDKQGTMEKGCGVSDVVIWCGVSDVVIWF